MYNEEKAREKLQEILNRQEYQIYYQDNRSFLAKWWGELKAWIMGLLRDWFSSLQVSSGIAEGIIFMVLVIVGIVVLLIIFLIIRTMKQKRVFRDHLPLQTANEQDWSYLNHLREAHNQESVGQYRVGTRHLFLALILYFHEQGWLEAKIWKTNWEYYAELRKINAEIAEQFFYLALLFDEVAYGQLSISKEEYLEYKNKVTKWINMNNLSSQARDS